MISFFRNFKGLPSAVLVELVASTISAFIILCVTFIVKNLLIEKIPELGKYEYLIYALWVAVIIWLLLRVYLKVNKLRPYFPLMKHVFHTIEKHIYHSYISDEQIIHRRRFKLLCLQDNVRFFNDKFIWTGEKYKIKCLDDKYTLILTDKLGHFDTYEIRFDRVYHKNDIIEFTVEWDCENKTGSARPYFSTTIMQPTDKLIMELNLSQPLRTKEASLDTCFSEGEIAQKTDTKYPNDGRVIWEIGNPQLLYHYKVRWLFS